MSEHHVQVVQSRGLTARQIDDIQNLEAVCSQADDIHLKLNQSMLQSRSEAETNDFLAYRGEQLVGFLGLYQFQAKEVEISGMVHPSMRRLGVFSSLVSGAIDEIRRRSVPKMVFINANGSASGKAFLESIGAVYAFSEYWMQLERTPIAQQADEVQLRPITRDDIPVVASILAESFRAKIASNIDYLEAKLDDASAQCYKILLGKITIGALSVNQPGDGRAFIYGFGIAPQYQGRGYGRQSLSLAVQSALQSGLTVIELEVACENARALTLYESCGFQILRANDYYEKRL
ncbi:GNAT family N-acetyltransferase [Alicyclobacillus fastidiosus]|uniref:GNAT family N-acetyltransferase n=1 Tax=Alicyclobacillus fastidiosus TaxID=392011 RepID=A0ABY6ZG68_9BACL|nr:GNAT family N-acetyltransferase [Alicyclobacillus fastidiosus]WAH41910.1 GNAT family N-acetyltransferase [Alicyclobacillus fastidiosus]GMA63625.1 N-acetyltransferase [Alicyclobacillus fastidiosus]